MTTTSTLSLCDVLEHGQIQIRFTDILEDSGKQKMVYRRYVLSPGDSLDDQADEVVTIANRVWTPQVVEAFKILTQARE
jgi:hypothetical protein